jgi:hypothetical protein
MRLAMTCGYRVFVCSNMAFAGDAMVVVVVLGVVLFFLVRQRKRKART